MNRQATRKTPVDVPLPAGVGGHRYPPDALAALIACARPVCSPLPNQQGPRFFAPWLAPVADEDEGRSPRPRPRPAAVPRLVETLTDATCPPAALRIRRAGDDRGVLDGARSRPPAVAGRGRGVARGLAGSELCPRLARLASAGNGATGKDAGRQWDGTEPASAKGSSFVPRRGHHIMLPEDRPLADHAPGGMKVARSARNLPRPRHRGDESRGAIPDFPRYAGDVQTDLADAQ
jgi:hypothetical protein